MAKDAPARVGEGVEHHQAAAVVADPDRFFLLFRDAVRVVVDVFVPFHIAGAADQGFISRRFFQSCMTSAAVRSMCRVIWSLCRRASA